MNKNYTLKELADIGLNAACQFEPNSKFPLSFQNYREAFAKAVLDAIGYEFPKDEEREAFERWLEHHPMRSSNDDLFEAWQAGREELRRALPNIVTSNKGLNVSSEPAWIPWAGGECPLPDGVKRWEYRARDQFVCNDPLNPSKYDWKHYGLGLDIVAYRVWQE